MADDTREKPTGPRLTLETRSGVPVAKVYGPEPPLDALGRPGEFPFTRGIFRDMYRGKVWTMRQYAGFGTAHETNQRFRYLLDAGQTGLSLAFDLPTQLGYDPDAPEAEGEVGRVGVAVASLDDMMEIFENIPLGRVTTSMTINATAAILLALYEETAKAQGVPQDRIAGTTQNDILKEFGARGAWVLPMDASMRLAVDVIQYATERLPRWNPISIASHYRDAGATPAEEMAYTLSAGRAYVRACMARGMDVDAFAPRLSFFFYTYTNFFEEVAKYRAGRRMWARMMREEFFAKSPESWRLRAACVCGGHSLTKAEPLNNIARTTIETMAIACSGLQSCFTAAYDEALAIPTELAARTALRVQQIVAYETDVALSADPLGGSYFVEALTDEMEAKIRAVVDDIEGKGGMVECLRQGTVQRAIGQRAYEHERKVLAGETPIMGVNYFRSEDPPPVEVHAVDPALEEAQIARVVALRARRDGDAAKRALGDLESAARGADNLVPPIGAAVRARATIGEIMATLRRVFGEYVPPRDF